MFPGDKRRHDLFWWLSVRDGSCSAKISGNNSNPARLCPPSSYIRNEQTTKHPFKPHGPPRPPLNDSGFVKILLSQVRRRTTLCYRNAPRRRTCR